MANKVSRSQFNQIASFLAALGFNPDEVRVFQAMLEFGPLTKLELSRSSGVNRTRVYRIIEQMKKRGVVEEIVKEYTTVVVPAGLNELKRMVGEEAEKVQRLTQGLPLLESMFSQVQQMDDNQTKVIFYRGHEGIRQMAWNNLKAKGEIVGYTYRFYAEALGEKLFQDWLEEFIKRGIKVREIITDTYLNLKKEQPDVDVMPAGSCESRYIGRETLDYDHQLDIYNDVVAIYNWYEGEVFGVEIYNEKVAKLQKQLFEIVWKIAEPKKGDLVLQKS